MIELGMKDKIFGADQLVQLPIYTEPMVMPHPPQGSKVICGYDQGMGERIFVCESLGDMKELYASYARGGALRNKWYTGEDTGFVIVL
jgi:hypothetical protein